MGQWVGERQRLTVGRALSSVEGWVRQQNWVGPDPYDLRAHPLFRRLERRRLTAWPAKAAATLFPVFLRRLLRVEPLPHAKAMALFAEAYLTLFDLIGDEVFTERAEARLDWLLEHPSSGFSALAWGLPFPYQGREWVPADTPSIVITAIAARAFLHAYESLGRSSYLDAAVSACRFLSADVPRYEPEPDRLCFSKMTGVQWNVHNANLLVAATLAKVGRAAGTGEWNDVVRRAVNYTLAEQREDGAWYYWGPPGPLMHWIDHYHTGFVLRALDDLVCATDEIALRAALDKGYAFYLGRLFDGGRVPRFTDARSYPIDIHSCAEAILCLSQLAGRYADALARAEVVAAWTLSHMRHPDGYFFYRRYRWFTIRVPYMRWGQAWMMVALTRLLQARAGGDRVGVGSRRV